MTPQGVNPGSGGGAAGRCTLRIITYGVGAFGVMLRDELGERVRVVEEDLDCVGEAGLATSEGARVVLLIGGGGSEASEGLAQAVREVAPRAILLCDGGGRRLAWCDGVYDPDESGRAFIERLELLWLLGVPRSPEGP